MAELVFDVADAVLTPFFEYDWYFRNSDKKIRFLTLCGYVVCIIKYDGTIEITYFIKSPPSWVGNVLEMD